MPETETSGIEHHFRAVLGHFATGVAVVTALSGEEPVGLTIQAFSSLSLDPPLILICPSRTSTSWPRVAATGGCCVNLLAEDQTELALQFARSATDKYRGVEWSPSPETGSPVLAGGLAWIDCQIQDTIAGGDHLIVVCRVLALGAQVERQPLIFFKAGFRQMI